MNPTPAQQQAIDTDASTILVLAGPGSGKTATLIERLERKISDGCNPSGFAVITFTNAAADEIRERLAKRSHLGDCLGHCGTLHAFCLKLLQKHGHLIGFTGRLTVLDEHQAEALLERTAAELNFKGTQKALEAAIAGGPKLHLAGPAIKPEEIVASRFFKRLRAANLLTFDTVLIYAGALLVQHKEQVQDWTHLFVDEFQDAGDSDMVIYNNVPAGQKFFVGDPDQAIYGFRGGNIQNILGLAQRPGVVLIRLEDNFRSVPQVCQRAQWLIQHNTGRIKKETRSALVRDGTATATAYANQEEEIQAMAQRMRTDLEIGDCAVLLPTRHLVEEYGRTLESYGIRIAKRKAKELPIDWGTARALLAVLNDPENDMLAMWYLEATQGPDVAMQASLMAARDGVSLNAHALQIPQSLELAAVPAALARAGISRESIDAITKSAADMPEGSTLSDLVLALQQRDPDSEQLSQGVTVCTMHSAKGREFDSVFIPAFEEAIMHGRKDTDIQERRRLAYVAFTRARDHLIVSHCKTRRPQWGGADYETTPCRFVQEAGL
jgi:DNA helicase-2/ATP-dependent DNA helicase PcrA